MLIMTIFRYMLRTIVYFFVKFDTKYDPKLSLVTFIVHQSQPPSHCPKNLPLSGHLSGPASYQSMVILLMVIAIDNSLLVLDRCVICVIPVTIAHKCEIWFKFLYV